MIEVVAVISLMVMLAGAVAWSLADSARAAVLPDVAGRVEQVDALARVYARRFDRPVVIRFDLTNNRVMRVEQNGGKETPGLPYEPPSGYRIDRVMLPDDPGRGSVVDVPCSPLGLTPSYAVRLTGPQGRAVWLLVAGLSGQATEWSDEQRETVEKTLQALRPIGHDAD